MGTLRTVTLYKTAQGRWKWKVTPSIGGVPSPLDAFAGHKRLRDAFNNARREVGNTFIVVIEDADD